MEIKNLLLIGSRIEELRIENGLSVREMGEIVSLTGATTSRYANGKMAAKETTLICWANHFNVNPDWLLGISEEKYNEHENPKKIPLIGKIVAGQAIFATESIIGYEFISNNDQVDFALKAIGDSMVGARIYEGDIVFVQQQPDVENGEIAAVIIDSEEITLKRIYKINGSVILHSENPSYKDMVFSKKDFKNVRILGKAKTVKFNVG